MKADGHRVRGADGAARGGHLPQAARGAAHGAYEIYRRGHPWVDDYEIAPKSVVRDMSEQAMTFVDFIGYYGLARSEGVVLRYLADAFRALRQTVPEEAKTDELRDLIEWLGELVRQTDSSLLDEWEELLNPTEKPCRSTPIDAAAAAGDRQRAGLPGAGPQRDVPPGRAGRAAALGRPRRARAGERVDRPGVGRGTGALLRGAPARADRPRRPRAGACCSSRPEPDRLAGPPDPRRPGRRPRLGHQRRGRPARLRRGRPRRSYASPRWTASEAGGVSCRRCWRPGPAAVREPAAASR